MRQLIIGPYQYPVKIKKKLRNQVYTYEVHAMTSFDEVVDLILYVADAFKIYVHLAVILVPRLIFFSIYLFPGCCRLQFFFVVFFLPTCCRPRAPFRDHGLEFAIELTRSFQQKEQPLRAPLTEDTTTAVPRKIVELTDGILSDHAYHSPMPKGRLPGFGLVLHSYLETHWRAVP